MKPILKRPVERPGCAKPVQSKESLDDLFRSDDPEVQKKLDILKSMEGMWADKDTSFFDEE